MNWAHTYIMGIINLTPDSFSDGGQIQTIDEALIRATHMIEEGVDILDLGGQSSRPGATPVSAAEELDRVLPVVSALRAAFPDIPISVDTYYASVADKVLQAGADIINDISGLMMDSRMAETISRNQATCILMHMQGTPQTMQNNPAYQDLFADIKAALQRSVQIALEAGIPKNQIILDPGIGFGKTVDHNLQLIAELKRFEELGYALLLGLSRKSFIGAVLDCPVKERLAGGLAATVIAIQNGASILRVHDVKATKQAALMTEALLSTKGAHHHD